MKVRWVSLCWGFCLGVGYAVLCSVGLREYVYWWRSRIGYWAGELVCGFRTPFEGLRKLRPRVELQSPRG